MNWEDAIQPAGDVIKKLAGTFGPLPALLADAGVGLVEFGIHAHKTGLSQEAIIQELQDRHFDLLRQLKTGGSG